MNEALANRLVDFTLQISNKDLTRQELVDEFQRVLDVDMNDRIEHTKQKTIRACIKSLEELKNA